MTNLQIIKGKNFSQPVRWDDGVLTYRAITGITQASPAVITAIAHGIPNGWNVAVISAGGMRQINARNWPPRSSEFYQATNTDVDHVTLNDVNSAGFSAYTSGGSLVYYSPVSLAGYTARMQIRSTPESADPPLVSLVSPTGIVIDDVAKTITIKIDATATAAYDFAQGVYDLEMVSSGGVVTQLLSGSVTVMNEVTR
jgi:hypothetical protein